MPDNPFDFGLWFYNAFIAPLLDICKNTEVLGFSLFSWVLGLSVLALGVRFFRALFSAGDNK